MLSDIATAFWRDWLVLRHRLMKFILSRMVAPVYCARHFSAELHEHFVQQLNAAVYGKGVP